MLAALLTSTAAGQVSCLKQQQDALEGLLGICSGSVEGQRVVLESQGLRAAGLALIQV